MQLCQPSTRNTMTTIRDIVNNINGLLGKRAHLAIDDLKLIRQSLIGTYIYSQFRSIINLIGLAEDDHHTLQQSKSGDHQSSSIFHPHRSIVNSYAPSDKLSSQFLPCYLEKCELLLDFAWEHLNIGHWKSVKVDYRYLYGFTCIAKIILQLGQILHQHGHLNTSSSNDDDDNDVDIEDALTINYRRRCNFDNNNVKASEPAPLPKGLTDELLRSLIKTGDMACIMCPPIMDGIASDIACLLHQILAPNYSLRWNQLSTTIRRREKQLTHSIDPSARIEIIHCPSLETFAKLYLLPRKPCIITGAMDRWPACNPKSGHLWSLDYLLNSIGGRTVPVEIGSKYTDYEWSQKLMTVDSFVDKHWIDGPCKGYIAQQELFQQFKQLSNDFFIPDYCGLSPKEYDHSSQDNKDNDNGDDNVNGGNSNIVINGWFGPWATVSPLHHDPYDNLLTQVMGRKYIRLYSNSIDERSLYPFSDYLLSNTSQVDVDSVDEAKFPLFTSLPYLECYLEQGQMLYIPKGYWHYVKSLSISFSINFWWT